MTIPGLLQITVRQWRDAAQKPSTLHPEIVLAGDRDGLRHLRDQIDLVLDSSTDFHTQIFDGDGPGITTIPPKVMMTIERLDPAAGNGADVHSAS